MLPYLGFQCLHTYTDINTSSTYLWTLVDECVNSLEQCTWPSHSNLQVHNRKCGAETTGPVNCKENELHALYCIIVTQHAGEVPS